MCVYIHLMHIWKIHILQFFYRTKKAMSGWECLHPQEESILQRVFDPDTNTHTHPHMPYMTRYTFQFLKKYICMTLHTHMYMCVEYIKEKVQPRGRNTNLQRERKKNGIKKYMFYCSIFFPPSLRDDPKPTELPGAGRCSPLSKPIYTHTHCSYQPSSPIYSHPHL